MRKALIACAAVAAFLFFSGLSSAQTRRPVFPSGSFCDDVNSGLCTELNHNRTYEGKYSGHDEPSLLFYSHTPGSGNTGLYLLQIPKDPPRQPAQDGTNGVTWNFELHPAFWVGMALCDSQSDPNYTDVCKPDTDENIFDNPNPSASNFIGKHPGVAFLELQFYPPGWNGSDCYPTTWCAAMTIDSYGFQESTGLNNNNACLNSVGEETVNFAFITFSGESQAAANPLSRFNDPNFTAGIPNPSETVFFNPGDIVQIFLHDTPEGLRADIFDFNTGKHGSMTASIANGFGQVDFNPTATTCSVTPYAFHPMYSTSSEHTRVVWAAHSYNIAFSDEIGHFEWCDAIGMGEGGPCTVAGSNDPGGLDSDDSFCFDNAGFPNLPSIIGCEATEFDFDGVPYYASSWPGGTRDSDDDRRLRPEPIRFTSPVFQDREGGLRNYERVGFETDMPAIEGVSNPNCNILTGGGCTNPPNGAQFYPIFSTTEIFPGVCAWQEGGGHIIGTKNNFGGNSTAEYGSILGLTYINLTSSIELFTDYRRILPENPCNSFFGRGAD
jgi:hypothetical protein